MWLPLTKFRLVLSILQLNCLVSCGDRRVLILLLTIVCIAKNVIKFWISKNPYIYFRVVDANIIQYQSYWLITNNFPGMVFFITLFFMCFTLFFQNDMFAYKQLMTSIYCSLSFQIVLVHGIRKTDFGSVYLLKGPT